MKGFHIILLSSKSSLVLLNKADDMNTLQDEIVHDIYFSDLAQYGKIHRIKY